MKKLIVFLLFICVPGACLAAPELISAKRVHDLIHEGSGLWMIDVRSRAVYGHAHIEGAINIPLTELASKRLPENKILVLVDNSLGQLQAHQAAKLVKHADGKTFLLAGGVKGWQQQGLPLVGGADLSSLARLSPAELLEAKNSGIAVDIYDLRSDEERKLVPLSGVETTADGGFDDRLEAILSLLQRNEKGRLEQLQGNVPVVLILPAKVSATELYHASLWNLPGDVRLLEGGYLATSVSETRTVNSGGCMVCPGQ